GASDPVDYHVVHSLSWRRPILFSLTPQEKAGTLLTGNVVLPPMHLMYEIRSICVYCGSSPGRDETFLEAGEALGRALAENGLRLVYGGGTKGIMGAVARGAASAGGGISGIIPR